MFNATTVDGKCGDNEWWSPTASIEVLALARSPDDLRSSLRAAKEKYSRASPKARLADVLACAPKAGEMAR